MSAILPRVVLLGGAALLSGCTTLSFYWQAFAGQMELTRLSRPLQEVMNDPGTGDDLKRRLAYAQDARDFASRELGLPDNASYRRYADLKRPFVVWNVFAAPELSLELRTQCFPVAGCVVYRGYFAKAAAEQHASALRAEGLDVYVGGVPAYSTLGWFADPLLNTVIRYPDLEIARLIFHELAHQVAYVRDDSSFNESFAVALEEEGLRRWIAGRAGLVEQERYTAYKDRQRSLMRIFAAARRGLADAYAGSGDDGARRREKTRILRALADDYATLKAGWRLGEAELRTYDTWVLADLNNAKLGSIATYTRRVPQFRALLQTCNGDLRCFYREVGALAALPQVERNGRLHQLSPESQED